MVMEAPIRTTAATVYSILRERPMDSIMDWVNNEESLYNMKIAMFDRWIEEGDAWSEEEAKSEAVQMASRFAGILGQRPGPASIMEAAMEMMEEYVEHREYAIKAAVEHARHVPTPEELEMTPGDVEHAKKYEEVSRRIGIDVLAQLVPASPEKVRKALERGDKHLNTIPLRKWDDAAAAIPRERVKGLSLAEKVCALKHVAKWHYA